MSFLFTLFCRFVLGMCTHSLPLTESQILWNFLPVHAWHTPGFVWHSLLSADGPICVIDFSWVKRDDWHRMSHVVAQSSVLPINTSHKQQPKVYHFRLYITSDSCDCVCTCLRGFTLSQYRAVDWVAVLFRVRGLMALNIGYHNWGKNHENLITFKNIGFHKNICKHFNFQY
jgi:hypothetical protein